MFSPEREGPQGNCENPTVIYAFVIQTVHGYNARTNLPFRPSRLYLYSDGTMGVRLGDHHGFWWQEGLETLFLQYNYRGTPNQDNAISVYLRIQTTTCWMSAPPHMHPSGWSPNISVLVPPAEHVLPCWQPAPCPPLKRRREDE